MTEQAFNIYRGCCRKRIRSTIYQSVGHTGYSQVVPSHSRKIRVSRSVVMPPLERVAHILSRCCKISIKLVFWLGLPCKDRQIIEYIGRYVILIEYEARQ